MTISDSLSVVTDEGTINREQGILVSSVGLLPEGFKKNVQNDVVIHSLTENYLPLSSVSPGVRYVIRTHLLLSCPEPSEED